jgi:nitrous oxidase accessory protein NosD
MLTLKIFLGLPIFAEIILLMVISLSPIPTASAAKVTVPTDFPTLQASDTIKVLPGTYTEQITITKTLTLTGAEAKSTVINAEALHQHLSVLLL